MGFKRVHGQTKNTAGKHFARRPRRRRSIPVSTAAALVLGCLATAAAYEARAPRGGATMAAHEASVTRAEALRVRASDSTSRPPAPRGTGVVDPAVKPYLTPKLLKAVPVGPGPVSKPVKWC